MPVKNGIGKLALGISIFSVACSMVFYSIWALKVMAELFGIIGFLAMITGVTSIIMGSVVAIKYRGLKRISYFGIASIVLGLPGISIIVLVIIVITAFSRWGGF